MTERAPGGLDAALTDLAAHLDWPEPPPGLAASVSARVARVARVPAPARRRPGRPRPRLRLRVAAVILLLLALVVASLPGPRAAIADLLGIGAVRVTRVPSPGPAPPPVSSSLGEGLGLGRRVTLAEAGRVTGAAVAVPARLGPPDAVWLDTLVPRGAVTLVYRPRAGLPAAGATGIGALLTSIPGSVERDVYLKKLTATGTTVREVRVGQAPGLWIEGDPHVLFYTGADGITRQEPGRLAGDTLLWERDGRTLRLEAGTSRQEAIAIATSLP